MLRLDPVQSPAIDAAVAASGLTRDPAFSALVIAQGNHILHQSTAPDFPATQPHSMQSISKMHIHILTGELIDAGLLDPDQTVGHCLPRRLAAICDAAGYEGALHISLSTEGHPAFSGGGCLSVRDMARFGLLLARRGGGVDGSTVGSARFLAESLTKAAPTLSRMRHWQRYSNHLMTDGRFFGHAGYGGQYLMVDGQSGRVAAFFSVLENESGYDEGYMCNVVRSLQDILAA